MTITTKPVLVRIFDGGGQPCPDGTVVTAKLDKLDREAGTGIVAPSEVHATTVSGVATLNCFPNHPTTGLGTTGSVWKFTASPAGMRAVKVYAQTPNSSTTLDAIGDFEQVEGRSDAEAALAGAQAAAGIAASDAALTAADRIATAADRVQTGLDRVQTGLDRAAAAVSASGAAASRSGIDNRIYPGTYAADPVTRPNGSAIQAGDVYFTTAGVPKNYASGTWSQVPGVSASDMANTTDPLKGSALIGHRGETLASHLSNARPNLSKFWRGNSVSGRKVFLVGDSRFTEANTAALYAELRYFTTAGDLLGGATIVGFGSNGNTLANFVNDPVAGAAAGVTYNDLKAQATANDLIVVNYGMNDVRQGATSTAQLQALFETLYRNIAKDIGCDVVHFAGNPLTQDDAGGVNHFVKTAGGVIVDQATNGNGAVAQTYTQILIDTANYFKNRYRNVAVLDSFATCFGYLAPLTAAGSGWANDQLHPNQAVGMVSEARAIAAFAAPPSQVPALRTYGSPADMFSKERSNAAIAANPTSPWLLYPRVLEDTDYFEFLFESRMNSKDANSISLITFGGNVYKVQAGDLVLFSDDNSVWTVPTVTFRNIPTATTARWGFGTGTGPATGGSVVNSMVRVYRHRNFLDSTLRQYLADGANVNKWRASISGGTNFFILQAYDYGDMSAGQRTIKVGDLIYKPGVGLITVTVSNNTLSGANLQVNQTGDFNAYQGVCWVISTRPLELNAKTQAPMHLRSMAALTVASGLDAINATRGGVVNEIRASLLTPGTGGNTVVTVSVGGTVKATLTFSTGQGTPTIAWTSGSSFAYRPGDQITLNCTSLTGSPAGLTATLDIA